jgi:hypothetical protein
MIDIIVSLHKTVTKRPMKIKRFIYLDFEMKS